MGQPPDKEMKEYTSTGEEIHDWVPADRSKWQPVFKLNCTLNAEQNDRFRSAFGNINVAAFLRGLVLKAIEEKENEDTTSNAVSNGAV
jgi:hypothetical protein